MNNFFYFYDDFMLCLSGPLNESLEKFIIQNWHKLDLVKIFSVLIMIAKTDINFIGINLKPLVLNKVLESQSKFIHNNDLKRTLIQFLDLIDMNDELKLKAKLEI
jgi:hypothetical protein